MRNKWNRRYVENLDCKHPLLCRNYRSIIAETRFSEKEKKSQPLEAVILVIQITCNDDQQLRSPLQRLIRVYMSLKNQSLSEKRCGKNMIFLLHQNNPKTISETELLHHFLFEFLRLEQFTTYIYNLPNDRFFLSGSFTIACLESQFFLYVVLFPSGHSRSQYLIHLWAPLYILTFH